MISHLGCLDLLDRGATCFPMWIRENGKLKANLKQAKYTDVITVQHYLDNVGLGVDDLFYHVLAALHSPGYCQSNAGALQMGWPRVPLPDWPEGKANGIATLLSKSAARGRELASLLDFESGVPNVTAGALRAEIAVLAVPSTVDGRNMAERDFLLEAGWGRVGANGAVSPGKGRAIERAYTSEERVALGKTLPLLGETTYDIYLNDRAFWCNVPPAIWNYQLGGYPVLKKWLSYRERAVLKREIKPDEVVYFADVARRIGAIICWSRQ